MPTLRTLGIALASAATAASLTITGQAVAQHGDHSGSDGHSHAGAVPPPPAQPTRDDQIQNVDQVKTAIKAYYGDTLTTTPDPVTGATMLHTFDPNGAYAHQMHGLEHAAERYLGKQAGHGKAGRDGQARGEHGEHGDHGRKAILLDVDDTSLNTYNYEIYSNFVYNPTTNGAFVNGAAFPAVPGMTRAGLVRPGQGLRHLLPHRPPRGAASGHHDQPRQRPVPGRDRRPPVPQGSRRAVARLVRTAPARRSSTSR